MEIRLFGVLAVRHDGSDIEVAALPRCGALLAYLVLHRDRAIPRKELAFALWPDVEEEAAFSNLRRHLHALTGALPDVPHAWILTDRTSVRVNPAADWQSDVATFDRAIDLPSERAVAVAAYAGDLLTGLHDDWAVAARERYRARALDALEGLALTRWLQHDAAGAIGYARRALQIDPLRESTLRRLLAMLQQAGDRAAALVAYAAFAERLRDDVDAEPMSQTKALIAAIRDGVGAVAFPNNLPSHLTPFFAREDELADAVARLERSRLVTLVGPGGIGKTRIALEVATLEAARFEDGAFFVDLAPVLAGSDTGIVAAAVARALDLRAADGIDAMIRAIGDRSMLLVMDNCEHVVGAAARLCDRLGHNSGSVRIVATSREPLGLPGEAIVVVPSFGQADACTLFAARANRSENEAGDVAAICGHLDGIPLAIELAAAAAHALSLDALRAHLAHASATLDLSSWSDVDRQRTLRDTLAWSFALLAPEIANVLLRLSVFVGGWTLEAAAVVCSLEPLRMELLLAELERRSWIARSHVAGVARYSLLETIRAFAMERRFDGGRAGSAEQDHATHFRLMVAGVAAHFTGPEQSASIASIDADLDNIRAALQWTLVDRNEPRSGVALALGMRRFWEVCGYYDEGRRWMEATLRATDPESRERVDASNSLGTLCVYGRPIDEALAHYGAALDIAERIGYDDGVYHALMGRAYATMHRIGRDAARPLLEATLARLRSAGDRDHGVATTLGNLGFVHLHDDDLAGAEARYREASAIFRRLGDDRQGAWIDYQLARVAIARGSLDDALALVRHSLAVRIACADRRGIAESQCALGEIALAQGETDRAREMFIHGERLSQEIGWQRGIVVSLEGNAEVARLDGDLARAERLLAEAAAFRITAGLPREPGTDGTRTIARYRSP